MVSYKRVGLLLILVSQVLTSKAGDKMGTGFKKGQFFFIGVTTEAFTAALTSTSRVPTTTLHFMMLRPKTGSLN